MKGENYGRKLSRRRIMIKNSERSYLLCDSSKLGKTYLNTLFNRHCGKSISRYLIELRLSLARRLLLHSPLSTKEISAECGHSRSNYFCRIFRQEHGCTPKKFRMKQGSFDYNSQPSSD
mgnify:CR=1 FL=1